MRHDERIDDLGLVRLEIGEAQAPSFFAHVCHQRAGDVAPIEAVCAIFGDLAQRCRKRALVQVLLGQRGPFARQRPLPVIEKQFCGVGIARQRARVCTGQQRCIKVDDQTILGELGGRRHEVAPGQASEQAVRQIHARHHAGHGNRSCAEDVAVIDDRRPWEQVGRFTQAAQGVIGRVELARRTATEVDDLGAALLRAVEHHGAARGGAAHPGLHHADGERRGDCGIHGIAAGLEHCGADLGRTLVLRRDHAPARGDDRLAHDLGIGEIVDHVG